MSENKQRINMAHGFMKHIIRNQIDRDNYDKEKKAQQQEDVKPKAKGQGNRTKKPEVKAYIPPQRFKRSTGQEQAVLFTIEYKHKDGEVFRCAISKCDVPEDIARMVGARFDLPQVFEDALAQRLHEELVTRGDI